MDNNEVAAVFRQFAVYGDLQSFKAFGDEHINNTYLSVWDQAGTQVRYTHQRINKAVFKQPEQVIENIRHITGHIAAKLGANTGGAPAETGISVSRRVLRLVPTRSGKFFYIDSAGEYWRTYLFIEHAATFEVIESPELAYKVGSAVGTFQRQLSDYAGPPLYETIPDFHNMRARYAQLVFHNIQKLY